MAVARKDMWKPDESLDDFVVKAAMQKPAEPPSVVSLRFTGEVEVLKPLARREGKDQTDSAAVMLVPNRFSWFHRSLAIGGAFAMGALVLASAIIIGMYDLPAGIAGDSAEMAVDDQLSEGLVPTDEPFNFDVLFPKRSMIPIDNPRSLRPAAKRRPAKLSIRLASYRPRRRSAEPSPNGSQFAPTTTVIYLENGEIKSRIEPWLTASYKKPDSFSN